MRVQDIACLIFFITFVRFLKRANDSVAQLVEQLTLNQRAQGSSPCGVTGKFGDSHLVRVFFFCSIIYSIKICIQRLSLRGFIKSRTIITNLR